MATVNNIAEYTQYLNNATITYDDATGTTVRQKVVGKMICQNIVQTDACCGCDFIHLDPARVHFVLDSVGAPEVV
jgi:hypothetical protein